MHSTTARPATARRPGLGAGFATGLRAVLSTALLAAAGLLALPATPAQAAGPAGAPLPGTAGVHLGAGTPGPADKECALLRPDLAAPLAPTRSALASGCWATAMTVDQAGAVYFAAWDGRQVLKVDLAGTETTIPLDGPGGVVEDLAVGPDGSIYLVRQAGVAPHLYKFDPAGRFVRQIHPDAPISPDESSLYSVAVDAANNVHATGLDQKLFILPSGGTVFSWRTVNTAVGGGVDGPYDTVRLDGAGNVYAIPLDGRPALRLPQGDRSGATTVPMGGVTRGGSAQEVAFDAYGVPTVVSPDGAAYRITAQGPVRIETRGPVDWVAAPPQRPLPAPTVAPASWSDWDYTAHRATATLRVTTAASSDKLRLTARALDPVTGRQLAAADGSWQGGTSGSVRLTGLDPAVAYRFQVATTDTALLVTSPAGEPNGLELSGYGGKCAGVTTGGPAVTVQPCGTAATAVVPSEDGRIKIGPSGCLDLQPGGAGWNSAPVHARPCDPASEAQRWTPFHGGYRNLAANKCLDDYAFQTADGSPIVVWPCGNGANQQWSPLPLLPTVGDLATVLNAYKCADFGDAAAGRGLVLRSCNRTDAQRITVAPAGPSTLRPGDRAVSLRVKNGMCLDVAAGGARWNGPDIQTRPCDPASDTQKWAQEPDGRWRNLGTVNENGSGQYVERCIADYAFGTADGNRLVSWTCATANDSTRWYTNTYREYRPVFTSAATTDLSTTRQFTVATDTTRTGGDTPALTADQTCDSVFAFQDRGNGTADLILRPTDDHGTCTLTVTARNLSGSTVQRLTATY